MGTTILNKLNKNKNNNPIGVLDSGVGGLTVLSRLIKVLPNEGYIYFGDTKNLPYGNKTPKEVGREVSVNDLQRKLDHISEACTYIIELYEEYIEEQLYLKNH